MVNMTLSIPEKLYKEMSQHTELKWSDIARQAFERKIHECKWMEKVLQKSMLNEQDAEEIGHKIKQEMRKRFV
jgi:O-methyltransferase involved in polyketide biosynthesis